MKALITGGMEVMGTETSRNVVQEGICPVIYARHRDVSLIYDVLDPRQSRHRTTIPHIDKCADVLQINEVLVHPGRLKGQ